MRSKDGAVPALRIFIFAALFFVLSGCGSEQANVAPTVTLDPDLQNGDTVHSRLTVTWSGSDPDGRIDHYEYVLDPPAAFTEEELANGGAGMVMKLIPGSGGAPTVTRVSKVVDGTTIFFDWVHTKEIAHEFLLPSTEPDPKSPSRFQGQHALYVRAIDDDGAASVPDHVAFTSKTLAPITRIVSPQAERYSGFLINEACMVQTFRWEARGRDGRVPQHFLYKILRVDNRLNYVKLPEISTDAFFADSTEWVETDQNEVTINLPPLSEHIFAVRAVDAGGIAEPYLEWGRNALKMQVFNENPRVSISLFGFVIYPEPGYTPYGEPKTVNQIPAEFPFRLTWSANTQQCGLDGYSWGLDLISTDETDRGWSSWGHDTASPVLSLSPGGHTFSVRARDAAGSIGIATVTLEVLTFAPDREVLYVDDSFDNIAPRDSEHDAFWHSMIDGYSTYSGIPRDQFGEFPVHGDGDRGNLQPKLPALSELFHYKIVIWENAGWGYNSDSALIRCTGLSNRLALYLGAGGKVWLDGRMTVAATVPDPNRQGANLEYPITNLGPGEFAWDFLKLHSSKINNDKGMKNANLFREANVFPGVPAVYDTMSSDLAKLNIFQATYGGFSHADAVFGPIDAEAEPGFRGDIDSLYAYGAVGGDASPYNGKLCALRWHDPDPKPLHGRIQWFGFALYFMHTDQAQKTFNQSLDWFREGP